ncbi:MAG: hypothetical protein N2643_01515 [Endomicrobia bacterium]|nr:hypothetical protein [Endomicrobiia bacterium]
MDNIYYIYKFHFNNEIYFEYKVEIDKNSLLLIKKDKDKHNLWTELEYHKCPNCPLDNKSVKYCPAATSVEDIIEDFSILASHTEVELTIETKKTIYKSKTSLQKALGSIIGLSLACSGCPILSKLRPLATMHLPLANSEETAFRVISFYLFAQYIAKTKKIQPDWELKNLLSLYQEIRKINNHFCERIRSVTENDASTNAIIILNCFVDWIEISITKNYLKNYENWLNFLHNKE